MSGHFVVWKVADVDFADLKKNFEEPGKCIVWTDLAHAANATAHGVTYPGWTDDTRAHLNKIRDGRLSSIPNRNNLPPHRYIEIPGGDLNDEKKEYLRQSCEIMRNLHRPFPTFKLTDLNPNARDRWNAGDRVGAFIEQLKTTTQIEVYYTSKGEMK
jgi:hypothetical protein